MHKSRIDTGYIGVLSVLISDSEKICGTLNGTLPASRQGLKSVSGALDS
jgi:hypothetical protein